MSEHDEHENEGASEECSSFEEILTMISPEVKTPVLQSLFQRGFRSSMLDAFAAHVQQDEGTEFTFHNLKKRVEADLKSSCACAATVILQPLKMEIADINATDVQVPNFPNDPSRGSHTVRIEEHVFIDRSDFRLVDSEDYFGLAPGKIVGLKYAFRVRCESVETDAAGEPVLLRCVPLPDSELPEDKPKGSIQWVPASTAVPVEVVVYSAPLHLRGAADIGWEQELAQERKITLPDAVAEAHLTTLTTNHDEHVMFDGLGFFAPQSSESGKPLFVQTIGTGSRSFHTNDDNSIRQRSQQARAQAEADKKAKLSSYLGSPSSDSPGQGHGSAKLTMAERAELARLKAEQETQARIEQMKQAKRVELTSTASGHSGISRAESARLQQERATQEKIEKLRQEKMAELNVRKVSGSIGGDDDALSPKQRQEEMRRRAEQERQERLAEFLGRPAEGGDVEVSALSVKERYERAKQLQQQQEEERLESFRSSTTRISKRGSVKEVWSGVLQESKSGKSDSGTVTASGPPSGSGLGSRVSSKWAEALNEQKQTEEQRYNQTKKQTISQFRLTDGTGLVKKRIGEWEELFMELAASVEELEKTLAAARLLSENSKWGHDIGELHRLQKEFRESAEVPEIFEMCSTKIYNIKLMDHHIASYIKRSLQDVKTKHFALSCGVYGDQEGGKPPIDLYAAAIKTDDKSMYIALTIKPTAGSELDPRAYGIKKVAIFSKDVNQKMLERVLDIVPQKGWEGWVARGHYGEDDPSSPLPASAGAVGDDATPGDAEGDGHTGTGPVLMNLEGSELDNDGAGPAHGVIHMVDGDGDVDGNAGSSAEQGAPAAAVGEEEEVDAKGQDGRDTPPERDSAWVDVHTAEGAAAAAGASAAMADILDAAEEGADEGEQQVDDDESRDGDAEGPAADVLVDRASATGSTTGTASGNVADTSSAADVFADVATPRESELGPAAGSGQPHEHGADGSDNPFFAEEDDDVESDVGETWTTKATPNTAQKNKEEEMQRNLSADYQFNNTGHDESLRFIKGEALPDADGDEEVEFDADEDLNATTFNAYKPSTVARVCLPRAFLPEHVSAEMLKNPATKYSWSIDDEREEGLPPADQCSVSINLQDIQNHHCCRNMLILEGTEQCMVFTGTLKYGMSESKYILNGNKIFEWVRGAACSGWLLKWPMQSQKFGRRMRRFFVLRDHILSYHVARPADEEEVYSNYSLSSLHITENTTVEVGRHMFLRSLIVTTPLDKLWIRMQNGSAEEGKWIDSINKSIKQLQRKKLFMSKVRIESKWYHESPHFNLVAVDALSYADQYIKIALFELHTPAGEPSPLPGTGVAPPTRQYSVDIGTNIKDGSALGIDGAPSTHSAKLVRTNESADLRSVLRCIKIYGDVILIGGSNGFLGVGAMGFTSSVDAAGEPMQVMFCVPCGTTQQEPTVSAAHSPITFRSGSNDSTGASPVKALNKTSSFMGAGPGFPHRKTATIVSIAAAQQAHRFVAADDEGTISLWYFYKQNAISENIENLKTPKKSNRNRLPGDNAANSAGGRGPQRRGSEKLMMRKPVLKAVLQLSSIDVAGVYGGERVVEMNFLLDESQLIVSTNKRLILLLLGKKGDVVSTTSTPKAPQRRGSTMSSPLTPFAPGPAGTPYTPKGDVEEELGFIGWVELDRAIPGKVGLFAMHMSHTYKPLYDGASTATIQRTITQWRITEEDQAVQSRFQLTAKKKAADGKTKCTVFRFEWTESMFSAALDQVKYF